MKTQIVLFCFVFFFQGLYAQIHIEDVSREDQSYPRKGVFSITPLTGYQLSSALEYQENDIDIVNGQNFGLKGSYHITQELSLDARYSTLWTKGDYQLPEEVIKDIRIQSSHYLLGASVYHLSEHIAPYVSLAMGLAHHHISGRVDQNIINFSSAIEGGVIIHFSQYIAWMLNARMLITAKYESINPEFVWSGEENDFFLNLKMSTPVLQGDFSTGLVIYLNRGSLS